jgi:hypothetical protein
MTARTDLAFALVALAPATVSVVDAPPRNAAPPFLAIAPGSPYIRKSTAPGCSEDWRLDVWCCVTRESVFALDEQDALIDLVRQAVDGMPHALWLGVNRANVSADDLAGVPYLAAIAEVRVMV